MLLQIINGSLYPVCQHNLNENTVKYSKRKLNNKTVVLTRATVYNELEVSIKRFLFLVSSNNPREKLSMNFFGFYADASFESLESRRELLEDLQKFMLDNIEEKW